MGKTVEFEIRIKGDNGVLRSFAIEADRLDEALESLQGNIDRTRTEISRLADTSILLDTTNRAIQSLSNMTMGLASQFNSFETAMRKANTMAGKSGDDFDALNDSIVNLSKNIPLARESLADGLYQVISNGVPEDNWIDFLEQSSKAAAGGVADLGQTVTVTSTLIKNYGKSWEDAGLIQDKIQTTAKNGVTSFEQLGQALPRVSGSAAQLGVSMDELMAVFATTTGVTGNTAEVSTQLAAVLNSLVKPSSEASKAAAAMGVQFDAAAVRAAGGFSNFLTGLDDKVKTYAASTGQLSETIYGQLFGSAEALRLLGSLTGQQKDKFVENIGAMADSAGAIGDAFAERVSTGESRLQMLQNRLASMTDWLGSAASWGEPFILIASSAGTALTNIVQLGTGIKGMVSAMVSYKYNARIASALTKSWTTVQAVFNAVFVANPIALVVTTIAALVAIIVVAYRNCESFRKLCDKIWIPVKNFAQVVWDYLVAAFERASAVIKKAWEWVKKFFGISDTSDIEETTEAIDNQASAAERLANAIAGLGSGKTIEDDNSNEDDFQGSGKTAVAPEGSSKWFNDKISKLRLEIELAIDYESRLRLQKELDELERQKTTIDVELKYRESIEADNLAGKKDEYLRNALQKSQSGLASGAIARPEDLQFESVKTTNDLDRRIDSMNRLTVQMSNASKATETLGKTFGSLGSAIGGAAGQWASYVGGVLSAVPQLLDAVARQIPALQGLAIGQATANAASAGPFGWLSIGAALASVAAAFASIPKFANGGIAYGPTLGLFGEYAGASSNPEVVAPLDKLRSMIQPAGQPVIVGGTLRASGRDIVCVLANETRISSKSGRRTNINI